MNSEQKLICELVKGHRRSPHQVNGIYESDAELIQVTPSGPILAITTDTLVEEIEHSLYTDPYMIGWMSVICCASDLAAVGAKPLGILMSATFTEDDQSIEQIQLGIKEACEHCSLSLLGGDTNFSKQLSMTGTAIGIIQEGKPLMRSGGKPGDILACSGRLGQGNVFAYQKLLSSNSLDLPPYRPLARLREGEILKCFASSCIDTSDGLLCCLEDIVGINPVGFKIETEYKNILSSVVSRSKLPIPDWAFLAGCHGEYELVFTIEPANWDALVKAAEGIDWMPIKLGKVVEAPGIHLKDFSLHDGVVGKTWKDSKGDLNHYLKNLLRLGEL